MSFPTPSPQTTAIVTGASAGIGVELARQLAARGHGLTLVARRRERLEELAAELERDHKVSVVVCTADLTKPEDRDGIFDSLGKLDLEPTILINNAGLSTVGPVHHATVDPEIAMIRTDVEAVVHMCVRASARMTAIKQGAILNVASTAAFQPIPGQAGYGGSKAFVLSYTEAIREELSRFGINVTTLCPGPVKTEFAEAAGFKAEEAEGSLPKFMWLEAAEVARQGIDGLAKNKRVVIPGAPNNALAMFGKFAPNRVLLPLLAGRHPGLKDG